MERLTKISAVGEHLPQKPLNLTHKSDSSESNLTEIIEKLGNYEDAEEQGLLLRLPCKVGDTVWQIMISGMNRKEKKLLYGIYEATVTEVSVDFYRNLLISTITNDTKKCKNKVTISAIGETIFLDREEAEAKLKEMEEK